jgi:hypothetical protein
MRITSSTTTGRSRGSIRPLWIAGLLALLASLSSHAAQLGPYLGGSYGVTEKDDDGAQYDLFVLGAFYPALAFTPSSHIVDFDTEDQGYMGLAGYRIHRNFALEGVFIHMGKVNYRAVSDGTASLFVEGGLVADFPLTLDTRLESSLSGLGMSALGIWPINRRWELYARGGLQFSTIRTNVRTVRIAGTERANRAEAGIARKSDLDFVGGVGIAMSMFEIYGARLEYMRVLDAGDDLIARGDADMLSLGFIVAF